MTAKNFMELSPEMQRFHLSQMNPQQLQQLCNELESLQRHYSALAEKVKSDIELAKAKREEMVYNGFNVNL